MNDFAVNSTQIIYIISETSKIILRILLSILVICFIKIKK